jgi:DUF2075 family protein
MTKSELRKLGFGGSAITELARLDRRFRNWPVVYTLSGSDIVYVGESHNVEKRFGQHLKSATKRQLDTAYIVVDDRFNKSACLDLESYLIRMLAGDGRFTVLNGNEGITDADYFDRATYRESFIKIFESLRSEGLFRRSAKDIQNSDLFKLSPYKALKPDQEAAVDGILASLFKDIRTDTQSTSVVNGEPGTGKTVVAIYVLKLLADVRAADATEAVSADSLFAKYFTSDHAEAILGSRVGLVIPQQSLRRSIRKVFKRTPGLNPGMVLDPFQVGAATTRFDLLVVDEAHRLGQRAAQASGPQNMRFKEITQRLFGTDDQSKTQLDWMIAQSDHQILLVDTEQTVRPSDIPTAELQVVVDRARTESRFHHLMTQHRVNAGDDYVSYVRGVLSDSPPDPKRFEGYDLRFFDDFRSMRAAVQRHDRTTGLARVLAGYAWEWKSKRDPSATDISIDGIDMQWNSVAVDWVASPNAIHEVGSIHTTQGYDLNYAGVIIGADLRYDPDARRIVFHRDSYFDARGKANNKMLGITYTDDDLLAYVRNIYAVLLTRGIRGTYVYVCDEPLRDYLRAYLRQ